MLWILLFFTLLYVSTSVDDAWDDVRSVFDTRLIRRWSAGISLGKFVTVTCVAALTLLATTQLHAPLRPWKLMALWIVVIVVMVLIIHVAWKDLTFRGTRRQYPARYDRHPRPQRSPRIRQGPEPRPNHRSLDFHRLGSPRRGLPVPDSTLAGESGVQ